MAFPTDDTSPLAAAQLILQRAKALRFDATKYIAQCDAGAINIHDVASAFMANHLAPVKTQLATLVAIPGVYDALVQLKPNKFADAAAAQTAVAAVQTAINDMIVFLEANLPMDAQRRVLSLTVSNDGSGTLTQRTITAAGSIASFRTQLVTFRDAFEA